MQTEFVVRVGELGERLEHRVAGARHDRIDVAHLLEQRRDRRGLVDIDRRIALAMDADHLVLACERLHNRATDHSVEPMTTIFMIVVVDHFAAHVPRVT